MLNGTTVFLASLGYVGFLFAVAWWGDHGGRRFVIGRHRALVYSLSLAIYCTSWTYYGSVGLASTQGFDFLPIYIGPILVVGLGYRLIGRIGDLSRAQNLTTVADFVSARYGKSQAAAALAALIALTASAPYIALQLKSITQTILMVVDSFEFGQADAGRADGRLRPRRHLPARRLRHGVRHAADRSDRAPGRADPGDLGRVRWSSSSPSSPSAPSSSGGCSAAWASCFAPGRRSRASPR